MSKLISVKGTYLLLIISFCSMILHNAIYAIFKAEEAVFFILTLISFFLFMLSIVLNLFRYITKKEPKDIWKLGFLGLLGLLGLVANPSLFGFFGFYAFFGMKNN